LFSAIALTLFYCHTASGRIISNELNFENPLNDLDVQDSRLGVEELLFRKKREATTAVALTDDSSGSVLDDVISALSGVVSVISNLLTVLQSVISVLAQISQDLANPALLLVNALQALITFIVNLLV